MSFTVEVATIDITNYSKKIEFWSKPLPFGIGRFLLELDNTSGDLSNLFAQDDPVIISRGALDVFAGYVDIPNPQVNDALNAHFNRSFLLSGRDISQDLMNLSVPYTIQDRADNIIESLLTLTDSELDYESGNAATEIYHDSKGWSYLIDQINSALGLVDYEGFFNPVKVGDFFPIGTKTSGITLQSKLNDPTNNIIKLLDYVEGDTVEQRNVIIVTGPELDDHFTELNAEAFGIIEAGNKVEDYFSSSPTTPRKGIAAIKVIKNAATEVGCKLIFPKYFLYYLDFSLVANDICQFKIFTHRVSSGGGNTWDLWLVDTDGNRIRWQTSDAFAVQDTWKTLQVPIGTEVAISGNWAYQVGSSFNWKVVEIWWAVEAVGGVSYFLLDAWKAPQTTYAVADHSGGVCAICGETFSATRIKHLPLSKSDIVSQKELEAYAESIVDKRMNPLKRLHLIADGDAGIIEAAWKWLPGYNVTVDVPDAEIDGAVYRMIDLHHVISESTGNDPKHTVELQLIPYNQVVDSQQWSYTKDGKIALIRRLHDRLRWLENKKGYVP